VSRVGGNAQIKPMKRVAGRLKIDLSQYRDLEAFAQFGSDLDPDTQRTLARGERLVATLNQPERSPLPVQHQVVQIYAATNGYLDRIDTARIPQFLQGLIQRMKSEHPDVLESLAAGDWSDQTVETLDQSARTYADDFGYDLDEEGQPMDEGEADARSGPDRGEGSPREREAAEGATQEAEDKEPAAA